MQKQSAAVAVAVACLCLALSPSPAHAAEGTSGTGSAAAPSCAAKLVPCAGYLNSTSSSTSATTEAPVAEACCGPLREAAANETVCLCAMLLNRAALRAFGVAPEQGLALARRCNVTTDASSACTTASTGGGATAGAGSTAASSASTGSAAAASSSSSSANGGSVPRRLSLTAASSLVGFSFIWWVIMA